MNEDLSGTGTERCLRVIYCEQHGCPDEKFEESLFWHCVPRECVTLAKVCWLINRRMFRLDLELLRKLGRCTSTRELKREYESTRHYLPPMGLIRNHLRVRVSGKQLLKFAARLYNVETAQQARAQRRAARDAASAVASAAPITTTQVSHATEGTGNGPLSGT